MYRKLVFGTALGFLMFAGDLWASTTGKCGTNCSYTMDDNGHVVISGSGTLGALQGVDKADIKSVSIEEGITGIGGWVFNGASLTEVTIPSSVSEIGEGVFNRTPLDRVNILGKDVKVQLNSFNNTTVTNMKYAGTVTWSCGTDCVGTLDQSGHAAFTGQGTVNTPANFKSSIKSATVGEGITGIGGYAFSGSNLASIDLPDSLESIGNYAFANTKLTEVTVPSSVSDTGDWAFYNTSLDTINILNDNVKMGASSFYGASVKDFIYTGTVTWPCGTDCTATFDQDGHVTVEGTGIMTSVSVLDILKPYVISATVGEGITGIGGYAFSGSNLASIDLPDSLESIGNSAFANTKLTEVTVPSSVSDIEGWAFYNTSLDTINILNDNVKMVGEPFYGASVKDFIYTGTVTWSCGTDCTATLDQDGHVTVEGIGTMTGVLNALQPYVTSATVGEGITGIGGYAFYGSNLASIDLPDSLESIAFNAFGGTELSGIILPPDFQTLDSGAFYGMNKNNIKLFYYSDEQKEKLKELGYNDTSLTPYIINDDGTVYYTDEEGYDVRFETYKTFKRGDVLEKYRLGADGKTYVYSPDNVLLKAFKKNADGSIYIYDTDGNLKEIRGKKIYTVEEAMAVTRDGNVNRVRLTYK